MTTHQHHEDLITGITEQMGKILDKSTHGIYLYLDDTHKVCNKKFSDMVGYKSPAEWGKTEAPLSDVVEADRQNVINAYMNASEKMTAGALEVRFTNVKTGKILKAQMIIAPVAFGGHVFTAHFFNKI
jgi:hypothetical protein